MTSGSGTVATSGLFAILVGAWAGIAVFVGPLFGYYVDGHGSWHWNLTRALLHFAPGVAAIVAGLILLSASPGILTARSRVHLGGFLAIVAGAWLVIGPLAWPVLEGARHTAFSAAGPLNNLANQAGANLGPGLLLAILGCLSIGVSLGRGRAAVVAEPVATSDATVIAA